MPEMKKIMMEPWRPRKGFKLRRWCVQGKVFEAGKTYAVDKATAAYLLSILSEPRNEGSPPAFRDVSIALKRKTKAPAPPPKISVKEDRGAGTLTTADLPENQPESEVESDDDWDEPITLPDKPASKAPKAKKPRSRSGRSG